MIRRRKTRPSGVVTRVSRGAAPLATASNWVNTSSFGIRVVMWRMSRPMSSGSRLKTAAAMGV